MQLRRAFVIILSLFLQEQALAAPHSIRVRISSAPATLDWNVATTGNESAILQNLMSGLFSRSATGSPKPVLAKGFEWSADRKDLKVTIDTKAEWSDGKKLNSSHFLDSFERLLSPRLNSENASLLFDVVGARDYFLGKNKAFKTVGIEAPSPSTLVFHLKEPNANFPNILTHWATYPVRKDNLKLTLGPYLLKSKSKTKLTLQARDSELPIQTATFEVIPDGKTAIAQFRSGKIDYLLQVEDSLLGSPDLKGLPPVDYVTPTHVVALLHLNPTRILTNTPEKRRAIMQAIPVQALLQKNGFNSRFPAKTIIPPGLPGGPGPGETTSFTPMGKTSALPKESLLLGYPPNDTLAKSIAEELQSASRDPKIIIEPLPKGDRGSASRYDLVISIFGLDYLDPDQLLASFLSQGTHDLFNVGNPGLLQILQKARSTDSIIERSQSNHDAADYLENKVAVVMPLFYRRRAYLLRDSCAFDAGFQGSANLSFLRTLK